MATQVQIPDDQLAPGDLVDVEYFVQPAATGVMVDLAIQDIKRGIADDARFHYQGSRWEERTDYETGRIYRYLIITVQVADLRKQGEALPGDPQEANPLVPLAILVALVTGAVIWWGATVVYRTYTIRRIATSDQSDAVKLAALNAAQAPLIDLSKVGVGTIAIGALFLYALFGRKARYAE